MSTSFSITPTSSSCSDSESPSPQNTPDERLLPGGVGVNDGDLQAFCIFHRKNNQNDNSRKIYCCKCASYTNTLVFEEEDRKIFAVLRMFSSVKYKKKNQRQ